MSKKNKRADIIFLIGAPIKKFFKILLIKFFHKSKIILRLDGDKWQYKYNSISFKLRVIFIFHNLSFFFYQLFADVVVYQSDYVKKIWYNKYFVKKYFIIHNGAEVLNIDRNLSKKLKIICIEGDMSNCIGAVEILNKLLDYEIVVYGKISERQKKSINNKNVKLMGLVSREEINKILKMDEKYIFLSLEYRAACPNSVIEAFTKSIPVIAHKESSVPELLGKNALYFKTYDGLKYNYQEINKKIKFIDNNYDSILKEINLYKQKLSLEKMLSNYTRVINEVCPYSRPE